jgi:hypothetical protein
MLANVQRRLLSSTPLHHRERNPSTQELLALGRKKRRASGDGGEKWKSFFGAARLFHG